jgi:hypothetical protein
MEVNFPMAKKLGLSYSRWKVAKHDSDSTVFVLGLFIHNLQITGLSEDSITLLTQKLETDPRLTIILENNDSISLDRFDFQYLQNVKSIFSVNDTSWTGIEY